MKTHKNILVIVAGLLLLLTSGCNLSLWPFYQKKITPIKPPPTVTVSPAPGPNQQDANADRAALISKGSAAIMAATYAASTLPPSNAGETTLGELKIAKDALPKPAPEDESAAMARAVVGLNGDLREYRKQLATAGDEIQGLRAQLVTKDAAAKIETERSAAVLTARENEWKGTFAALKKQADDAAKALEDAKNETSRRVQFWFALGLRFAAVALGGIGAFRIYGAVTTGTATFAAIKGAGLLLACSAGAFLLSWAVAQWWFYWACAVLVAVVSGLLCWQAYREQQARGALTIVAKAIDDGKNPADLDPTHSTVNLVKLSKAMDKSEKRLVKKVRSEVLIAKAAQV